VTCYHSKTAVRSKIPILTILFNNSLMGGCEKYLPVSTARYGARFLSGDYARVAEGLGGYTGWKAARDRAGRTQASAGGPRSALGEGEASPTAPGPERWTSEGPCSRARVVGGSGMLSKTLAALLKLSAKDRIELAMTLWESLTNDEREAGLVLTPEQEAELDRRLADHLENPGSAIPWEDIRRKLAGREDEGYRLTGWHIS
jgi:putative addiction module component (TIGR02574 family)